MRYGQSLNSSTSTCVESASLWFTAQDTSSWLPYRLIHTCITCQSAMFNCQEAYQASSYLSMYEGHEYSAISPAPCQPRYEICEVSFFHLIQKFVLRSSYMDKLPLAALNPYRFFHQNILPSLYDHLIQAERLEQIDD
jgi:hypothetical protein